MTESFNMLGRRRFLSSAITIGSVAFLTTAFVPERAFAAGAVAATVPEPPKSLATIYGVKKYMKHLPGGPGVTRTYKDAFKSTSVSNMNFFTGKDNRLKAVLSATGLTNQFQIVDALTGNNEISITPFSDSAGGFAGSAINPVDSMIYAVGNGHLFRFVQGSTTMQDLGLVAPTATATYGPAFDSKGRVWVGTFPDASVACYDPATDKFTEYPNVDPGSEYVRSIRILNDVVYVGTGAVAPKVFSFHVNSPLTRTALPAVPNISAKGFVFRIDVHAGKVFVSFETAAQASKTAVYNPATGTWLTLKYALDSRLSVSVEGEEWVYFVAKALVTNIRSVIRYNARTGVYEVMCATPVSPVGMILGGTALNRTATIFGRDSTDEKYVIKTLTLLTGAATPDVFAKVTLTVYKVQDLIVSDDGKLYVGGYMGDGIASIDIKTDARWKSPLSSPINQIEGMIEYDSNNIYVGSYGSADLIHFTKNPQDFTRIVRLRTDYLQSRPFGWAVAGGMVVCGTVPDYGYRGGALVVIDPATDALVHVYTGMVKDSTINIAEQSVVGLTGLGDIVYGTTSVKGGYGIPDDTNPAQVFAYDVKNDKALWSTGTKLTSETDIYDPVIVDGRLFVAVPNGIIELDIKTGNPIHTFVLFTRDNTAGYRNVRMGYVEESSSLIHGGGATITSVCLKDYSRTPLYSGSGAVKVKDGRIFAVTDGSLNVSEIDIAFSPTITSPGDLVSISPGGGINLKKTLGNGTFTTGAGIISTGYSDAKSVHAVDWNNDGVIDLVSRHEDGSLRVRYGLRQGGFDADFTVVAATGWDTKRITVGMWDASTQFPDVLSIDASGKLEQWKVSSAGAVTLVKALGTGWANYDIAVLDYKYDGVPGVVFREGVKMFWLAQGLGMTPTSSTRVEIASGGWSNCVEFAVVTNHYRSYNGIVWKDSTGLLRYTSNGSSTMLGGNFSYDTALASYRIGGTSK
jgi:hypothetical protein